MLRVWAHFQKCIFVVEVFLSQDVIFFSKEFCCDTRLTPVTGFEESYRPKQRLWIYWIQPEVSGTSWYTSEECKSQMDTVCYYLCCTFLVSFAFYYLVSFGFSYRLEKCWKKLITIITNTTFRDIILSYVEQFCLFNNSRTLKRRKMGKIICTGLAVRPKLLPR